MSVGFPQGKVDIDSRAGALALVLRDAFDDVARFKAFLDSRTDPDLTAVGYDAGDITLLRAAFFDLSKLGDIGRGQDTQGAASDFFYNAKHLTGTV